MDGATRYAYIDIIGIKNLIFNKFKTFIVKAKR